MSFNYTDVYTRCHTDESQKSKAGSLICDMNMTSSKSDSGPVASRFTLDYADCQMPGSNSSDALSARMRHQLDPSQSVSSIASARTVDMEQFASLEMNCNNILATSNQNLQAELVRLITENTNLKFMIQTKDNLFYELRNKAVLLQQGNAGMQNVIKELTNMVRDFLLVFGAGTDPTLQDLMKSLEATPPEPKRIIDGFTIALMFATKTRTDYQTLAKMYSELNSSSERKKASVSDEIVVASNGDCARCPQLQAQVISMTQTLQAQSAELTKVQQLNLQMKNERSDIVVKKRRLEEESIYFRKKYGEAMTMLSNARAAAGSETIVAQQIERLRISAPVFTPGALSVNAASSVVKAPTLSTSSDPFLSICQGAGINNDFSLALGDETVRQRYVSSSDSAFASNVPSPNNMMHAIDSCYGSKEFLFDNGQQQSKMDDKNGGRQFHQADSSSLLGRQEQQRRQQAQHQLYSQVVNKGAKAVAMETVAMETEEVSGGGKVEKATGFGRNEGLLKQLNSALLTAISSPPRDQLGNKTGAPESRDPLLGNKSGAPDTTSEPVPPDSTAASVRARRMVAPIFAPPWPQETGPREPRVQERSGDIVRDLHALCSQKGWKLIWNTTELSVKDAKQAGITNGRPGFIVVYTIHTGFGKREFKGEVFTSYHGAKEKAAELAMAELAKCKESNVSG